MGFWGFGECGIIKERNGRIKRRIEGIIGRYEEIEYKKMAREYETTEREIRRIYEEMEDEEIVGIIRGSEIEEEKIRRVIEESRYRCEVS